ncbi:hypothetical protein G7054_g10118 [Neopestalotiopsis clavispora]|nr:hypothetical protein G7054_g10118 [Neopestalotiopsis clavispora]
MGSVVLPHLTTGWHVDQAILSEEERLVCIRFGRDWDPDCMKQDGECGSTCASLSVPTVASFIFVPLWRKSKLTYYPTRVEVLYKIAEKVKNFCVIYLCDIDQVPDFNQMYELYDPCTIMWFFRNKHMMIDLGTGNNNKLNFVLEDKQELIDICETIYKGAKKGRGLVVSPKDYSTRYRY